MRAVFLDRDGVINMYPGDMNYVKSWGEFHFLPKAKDSLKRLYQARFHIFIISNQAGVSKGLYSQSSLDLITENMLNELGGGIKISGVFYCTHRQEDNCQCRKPRAGLIDMALEGLRSKGEAVDLNSSYFIGDTIRDIETGRNAGLKTILVFSGKEKEGNRHCWLIQPDFTAEDLSKAVELIIKQ